MRPFGSLRGYRRTWLRGDMVAGLTVWAVLVPEALAYATIAGVSPVVGLYAAPAALVFYALLGTDRSSYQGGSTSPPSAARKHRVPTHAELLEREAALGIDDALADLERNPRMVVPPPTSAELAEQEAAILAGTPFIARLRNQRAPSIDAAVERVREQTRTEMERILGGGIGKARTPRKPGDEQRHRANQVTAEFDLERALTFDTRA